MSQKDFNLSDVQRAIKGDSSALSHIINISYFYAFAFFRKQNYDIHTSEDLAQRISIIVFQKLHTIQESRAFWGWISITCRRVSINFTKEDNRRILIIKKRKKLDQSKSQSSDPATSTAKKELLELLRKNITLLKEIDREIISLFYLEELTLAELIEKLKLPEGTIKRRLFDARRRLRNIESVQRINAQLEESY